MHEGLRFRVYGKGVRYRMDKYDIIHCNRETMLSNREYSFAAKDNADFIIYVPDKNGVSVSFLEKKMGRDSDRLLFDFLRELNPLYKNIFSKDDHYIKLITLMFMYLEINYGDLKSGGFSFCSHSQGLLSFYADRDLAERFLEKNYLKNKKLLEYCFQLYNNRSECDEKVYRSLEQAIRHLSSRSKNLIVDRKILFVNEPAKKTTLDSSRFHTELYNNTYFIESLNGNNDFSVKRFTTICFYTFLKNTGINYEKRCIITHMIYRFIEDNFGFKYTDILVDSVKSQ